MSAPSNKSKKIETSVAHIQMASVEVCGPIPDAMQLERYEKIYPGAADRIITMAENQSKHRQELESIVVKSGARDSLFVIVAGFALGVITIVSGAILVAADHDVAGFLFSGTGLSGLVGVFIYGTRSSRAERSAKKENTNKYG